MSDSDFSSVPSDSDDGGNPYPPAAPAAPPSVMKAPAAPVIINHDKLDDADAATAAMNSSDANSDSDGSDGSDVSVGGNQPSKHMMRGKASIAVGSDSDDSGDGEGAGSGDRDSKLQVGDKVQAQWTDGAYYDSVITRIVDDDQIEVEYEGFDETKVVPRHSIHIDAMPASEGGDLAIEMVNMKQTPAPLPLPPGMMSTAVGDDGGSDDGSNGDNRGSELARGSDSEPESVESGDDDDDDDFGLGKAKQKASDNDGDDEKDKKKNPCSACWSAIIAKMVAINGGAALTLSSPVVIAAIAAAALVVIIILSVVLTLPETVSCHADDEKYFVVKIPKPEIQYVEPPMICNYYEEQTVRVYGKGFLVYNDEHGRHYHYYNDTQRESFDPPLAYSRKLGPFERADGTKYSYGDTCSDVDVRKQEVKLCKNYWYTIPALDRTAEFRAGENINGRKVFFPDLRVVNPKPEAPHATASISDEPCQSHVKGMLAITPPPAIADVFPPLICEQTEHAVTLTGEMFIRWQYNWTTEEQKPDVYVSNIASQVQTQPDASLLTLTNCQNLTIHHTPDASHCQSMAVSLTTSVHSPTTGLHELLTTNPKPVDCRQRQSRNILVMPQPQIVRFDPPAVCLYDHQQYIKMFGSNLVVVDSRYPQIHVDSQVRNITHSPVATCSQLDAGQIPGHDIKDCDHLLLTLDRNASMSQLHFSTIRTVIATGAQPGNTGRSGSPSGTSDPLLLDDCHDSNDQALLIVPPPVISNANPPRWCSADNIIITLTGRDFLSIDNYDGVVLRKPIVVINQQVTVPTASGVASFQLTPDNLSLSLCDDIIGDATFESLMHVRTCRQLIVTIPFNDNTKLFDGTNRISVRNPAPAQCQTSTDIEFVLYPTPVLQPLDITRVQTRFCSAEDIEIIVTGENLLKITDNNNPTSGGQLVPTVFLSSATGDVNGVEVPPTAITFPDASCGTGSPGTTEWAGTGLDVLYCTEMVVKLSMSSTPDVMSSILHYGSTSVSVSNPNPAICVSEQSPPVVYFDLIQSPQLTVIPGAFCQSKGRKDVTITGDIYKYDSNVNAIAPLSPQPAIYIDGHMIPVTDVYAFDGCQLVDTTTLFRGTFSYAVEKCTSVKLLVNGTRIPTLKAPVSVGLHTLHIDGDGSSIVSTPPYCQSSLIPYPQAAPTNQLRIRDPAESAPVIQYVSPPLYCFAEGGTINVGGRRFAQGMVVTLQRTGGSSSYLPIPSSLQYTGETNLTMSFSPQEVPPGLYDVYINDVYGGCGSDRAIGAVTVHPQPLVFFVDPPIYYVAASVQATIYTSGLSLTNPARLVTLTGPNGESLEYTDARDTVINTTAIALGTPAPKTFQLFDGKFNLLQLIIPSGLAPGRWNVRVETIFGCGGAVENAFDVVSDLGVDVETVDPKYVWQNSSTAAVEILGPTTPRTILQNVTTSVTVAQRVVTTFQDIITVTQVNNEAPTSVTTRSADVVQPMVVLTSPPFPQNSTIVDPPVFTSVFNSTTNTTTNTTTTQTTISVVTIVTTVNRVEQLTSLGQFEPTPRLYLNPQGDSGVASPMRAVLYQSSMRLTAAVPQNLPVGTYDLIVINPDTGSGHAIGILYDAIVVIADQPPTINAIAPVTLLGGTNDVTITISGERFEDGVMRIDQVCVSIDTGVESSLTIPIAAGHALDLIIASVSGAAGQVCTIEITNTRTGGSDRFAAISYRSGSANFVVPFVQRSNQFNIGRYQFAVVEGRATKKEKYNYIIGGWSQQATTPTATATVEVAQVDEFGDPAPWRIMNENPLPHPRAGHCAVTIDNFLYVIGGGAAVDTPYVATGNIADPQPVVRAQVLSPFETPSISIGVAVTFNQTYFGQGAYTYRISAVFALDDVNNPGGETLPGEAFTVTLPTVAQSGLRPVYLAVQLIWDAIPGAIAYNVYRTPSKNQDTTQIRLLAVVNTNQYDDNGKNTTTTSDIQRQPLLPGSLGRWHSVNMPALSIPRMNHACTQMPSINNPLTTFHLYVAGGRSTGGTTLDTMAMTTVTKTTKTTILSSHRQVLSTFVSATDGTQVIPGGGVYGMQMYGLTKDNFISTMQEQWLMIGIGTDGTGSATEFLWTFKLDSGSGKYIAVTAQPGNAPLSNLPKTGYGGRVGGCTFASSTSIYIIGGRSRTSLIGSGGSAVCTYDGSDLNCPTTNNLGGNQITPTGDAVCSQLNSLFQIHGGYLIGNTNPTTMIQYNAQ